MDGCLICGVRHIGSCRPDHPAHRPLSAEEWAERDARTNEADALAFVTEHRERVEAAVAAIKDPERRAEAERHLRTIREEAAAREQTPARSQEVELER